MASQKVQYALAARAAITAFDNAANRVAELNAIFKAKGFDSGDNAIVDADISGHDMDAADMANFSTFAGNLDAFLAPEIEEAIDGFREVG